MKLGLLTGGGDCPGLNGVIRAVVIKGKRTWNDEFVGFLDGWRGVLNNDCVALGIEETQNILSLGGTILGSSRTNPLKEENGIDKIQRTIADHSLDALIAIGGEDTLGVANELSNAGIAVIGVPKTIDNDLSATDVTFGFHTAVQIASDAIDRLNTTSASHSRVIVCEIMGRHAGWITAYAGVSGGAAEVLVPEVPFDIAEIAGRIQERREQGRGPIVIAVAEGAIPKEGTISLVASERDAFGHERLGGIGELLAKEIEARTGIETRVTVLGHTQRGGTPTAYDRVLSTRFGIAAVEAAHNEIFGTMVALRGDEVSIVPLAEGVAELKILPSAFLDDVVRVFSGNLQTMLPTS